MSTLTFTLSGVEQQKLEAWLAKHEQTCPAVVKSAARGKLTFLFTPTSIGVVIHAACACGGKANLTDYSSW